MRPLASVLAPRLVTLATQLVPPTAPVPKLSAELLMLLRLKLARKVMEIAVMLKGSNANDEG